MLIKEFTAKDRGPSMEVFEKEINRLLMHFERMFREANKKYINPEIEDLSMDGIEPIISMVAKSRAAYLKYVYQLGNKYGEGEAFPTADELKKLKIWKQLSLTMKMKLNLHTVVAGVFLKALYLNVRLCSQRSMF